MKDAERLLSHLPDEPEDEALLGEWKKSRDESLRTLRNRIASRWNYIMSLKNVVPKSHYEVLIQQMKESMSSLVDIHGQVVPFCPGPSDSLLKLDESLSDKVTSSTASTTASSQSQNPQVLPHTFKFLQLPGGSNDVWTCVQANGNCYNVFLVVTVLWNHFSIVTHTVFLWYIVDKSYLNMWNIRLLAHHHPGKVDEPWMVDGYKNFFSVTEWWCYKTPFSQWFTKGFETFYLPLAAALELSSGHVLCTNEKALLYIFQ